MGASGDEMINKFKNQNKAQLDNFLDVITPYHELFADLFEAIYFGDPGINGPAFTGLGLPIEPCRTFNSTLPENFTSDDPHCSLSSVRNELWQKSVVPSLPNKREILMKVADAIWTETQMQMASPTNRLSGSTAAKSLMNRLLGNSSH